MKRLFSSLLVFCLGLSCSAVYAANPTEDVVIHYSGTVVNRSCTISTPSLTVDFGDIQAADLQEKNGMTDWKKAMVQFTNCSAVTTITVTPGYQEDSIGKGYIASTGTAQYVTIEADSTDANGNNNSDADNGSPIAVNINGNPTGSIGFAFRVRNKTFNTTASAVTPGTVVATFTVNCIYK